MSLKKHNGYGKAMMAMSQRPIAVYPIHIRLAGSLAGGVFLSQLCYWSHASGGEEFYKTDEEIRQETGLTIREARAAKAAVRKIPGVELTIKGVPARTFYRIDHGKLLDKIRRDIDKIDREVDAFSCNDGVQASCNDVVQTGLHDGVQTITETTTETTTEKDRLPTAPAKPTPSADNTALDALVKGVLGIWEDIYGGTLPFGRVKKALKPILHKHDHEKTLAGFRKYALDTDARFASPERFVATVGTWIDQAAQLRENSGHFESNPTSMTDEQYQILARGGKERKDN